MAIGDSACGVMVAWKMVGAAERVTFRHALDVDGATWRRARGWAISQAMHRTLAYYTPENNPILVHEAHQWLREALAGE